MRLRINELSLPWKKLFAEFGVIVAGVLIALAVDSWYERQQEKKREKEYIKQLHLDFQETERRLQGTISGDAATLERVTGVLNRAFHGPFPVADSLNLPTGYNFFEPLTGTLKALVESGDLRLIHNDSLRFAMIGYSALIEATETILRHSETLVWNSMERLTLGRARHSQVAPRRTANGGRSWTQVDVVGVLNDPEIISALQVQVAASQIRLFNIRRLEKPTARIIRLLNAEIGNHKRKKQ